MASCEVDATGVSHQRCILMEGLIEAAQLHQHDAAGELRVLLDAQVLLHGGRG